MSKQRMKSKVRLQTVKCIRCLRPAKSWGGAVQMGNEWVLAGWCGRCKGGWFHGTYRSQMGKEATT